MLQLHYRKNYDFDTPPVTFCHCSRRNPSPPPHCNHLCHLFLPRRARTKKAIANMQKLSTFVSFFLRKNKRVKDGTNTMSTSYYDAFGFCMERIRDVTNGCHFFITPIRSLHVTVCHYFRTPLPPTL